MDSLMVILFVLGVAPSGKSVISDAVTEYAQETMGQMVKTAYEIQKEKQYEDRLQKFLNKKHSPMKARDFIDAGRTYGIDPELIIAIGQKESQSGKSCFRPYNCFGLMTSTEFKSYRESIFFTAKTLKGYGFGNNVDRISKRYCPPTHKEWARGVKIIMGQI